MAINKVVYGGNTLVDLTDTTATASDVAAGKYFYAADGTKQLGTSEGGTSGGDIYQDEDGYLVLGEEGGSSSGGDAREDLTEPKDVDFIDYDGRLIYSYTAEEFLALSALPPNPSNEGLIAQGWNWSFADAQEYVQKWGCLVVGQNYTTDDGRTRIYIKVPDVQIPLTFSLFVDGDKGQLSNNPTIYWGDGQHTVVDYTGTATLEWKQYNHVYSKAGEYLIEIEVADDKTIGIGYPYSNNGFCGLDERANVVRRIEIGDRVTTLWSQTFRSMPFLTAITIPITCVNILDTPNGNSAMFGDCHSLPAVVFPNGTLGRDKNMFTTTRNLKYISVPKTMNNIQMAASAVFLRKFTAYSHEPTSVVTNTVACGYCPSMTHFVLPGTYTTLKQQTVYRSLVKTLTIPASVTVIQTEAYYYNIYCDEYHLLPETPPTLNNTRAFIGSKSTSIFYVPYSEDHSILEAYKSATNWSTYASRIQEEPQ